MAKNLQGIAVNDLAVDFLRKPQSQIAFSRTGRPGNCNQGRCRRVTINRRALYVGSGRHGTVPDFHYKRPVYNREVFFGPLGLRLGRKKVVIFMIRSAKTTLLIVALGTGLFAQTKRPTPTPPAAPSTPAPQATSDTQGDSYYNFAMGRLYAEMAGEQGNRSLANRAVKYYEQALKDSPNVAIIADELTELYVRLNRLQDAIATGEDMLKKDPNNVNARRILGSVYVAMAKSGRGDEDALQKALEQYKKITQQDPSDAESWTTLGNLYRANSNPTEAEKAYKAALAADPNNAETLGSLARLYLDNHDLKSALEKFQAAADKEPSDQTYAELGEALSDAGKHREALDAFQKAFEMSPDNEKIAVALAAEMRSVSPPMLDDARKIYEHLATTNRREPSYPLALSEIYLEEKNLPKAREAVDRAKSLDPDRLDVRLNDGSLLLAESKPNDANTVFKGVIDDLDKGPSSDDAKARKLRVLKLITSAYERNKRWNEAGQTLDAAERAATSDDEKAEIYFTRGDLLERQKQYEGAEKQFRKVLELQPKNAEALNYLGYMLADRNTKLDEATQLVKKALDMQPDNGAFLDSMGWICFRQGKYSEAQGLLERALAQTPDPTIHDHLGDVLAKQGKTKEAASEWQASLKLARQPGSDPDEDEIASVTRKLDEAQAKLAKEGH